MSERIEEVEFEVGGERIAGWLHLPAGDGPHLAVTMLHSTAGVRQLRCYAERGRSFAEAGVATLQFDCRGFGASEGRPRQLFDVSRQAEDLEAALACVRERAEIDASWLALWGASASCAQVLDAAIRHDDIRAVVCLTPFVPGRATQRSAGTPIVRLGVAAFRDRLRRDPRGVRVGGEPGEAAILVREDAAERERAMLPPEARIDPSGESAELGGGVVWENRIIPGENDVLCPPGPAAELVHLAPDAELKTYASGHFDLYDGLSIPAETDFLVSALTDRDAARAAPETTRPAGAGRVWRSGEPPREQLTTASRLTRRPAPRSRLAQRF